MSQAGGCVCGATRYAVSGEPLSVHACHCTDCQTLAARDARPFDVALVSLGVNDVTSGVSVSRWRARHRRLRTLLRDRCGGSRLLAFGIPPMGRFPALPQPLRSIPGARAAALTRALAIDLAGEAHGLFLPMEYALDATAMARDGFHPGPAIYSAWGQRAAGAIDVLVSGEGDTP
jgi:lysophospholipase L1-like esterase